MIIRYADDFVCAFQYKSEADNFYRALPSRRGKFKLEVAPEKTKIIRFSRFHLSMKRTFIFLGFEIYWFLDHEGKERVMRRTARKRLQRACRELKEWIKKSRHLEGRQYIIGLNRRLRGHYNYYGLRGNVASLKRYYDWALKCTYKWLNRRGEKRKSFTWSALKQAFKRVGVALPKVTEKPFERKVCGS